jgi:hypothetical protein
MNRIHTPADYPLVEVDPLAFALQAPHLDPGEGDGRTAAEELRRTFLHVHARDGLGSSGLEVCEQVIALAWYVARNLEPGQIRRVRCHCIDPLPADTEATMLLAPRRGGTGAEPDMQLWPYPDPRSISYGITAQFELKTASAVPVTISEHPPMDVPGFPKRPIQELALAQFDWASRDLKYIEDLIDLDRQALREHVQALSQMAANAEAVDSAMGELNTALRSIGLRLPE